MNYTKDELAILVLNSLDGLEYKHESALLSLYENPSDLFEDPKKAKDLLKERMGEGKANTVSLSLSLDYAADVLRGLDGLGVSFVTVNSENYPKRLKNIDSPPLVLYYVGDISLLDSAKTFGIVGSRKTLAFAEALAEDISK